jgi:hypothetical protein
MRAAAFSPRSFSAPISWEAPDDMLWRAEHLRESQSFLSLRPENGCSGAQTRGATPLQVPPIVPGPHMSA